MLRQTARPLEERDVDDALRAFVADMGETMYAANGVGLAANQVGDLRRLFVLDVDQLDTPSKTRPRRKDASKRVLQTIINPEILESSVEDEEYNEGCLSIPGVEADVYRPVRIRVRYRTLEWEERDQWVDGLFARVFQHELDHLDGKLFVDHLPPADRERLAGALNKLKKGDA